MLLDLLFSLVFVGFFPTCILVVPFLGLIVLLTVYNRLYPPVNSLDLLWLYPNKLSPPHSIRDVFHTTFWFTPRHSRLTEKVYGPVHRLSIFIYKVLLTLS